jgi:DNA modification methylase
MRLHPSRQAKEEGNKRMEEQEDDQPSKPRNEGIPKPSQILMPLLEEVERKGQTTPRETYEALAGALEVSQAGRRETLRIHNGKEFPVWERNVRLAKQAATLRGLMPAPGEVPKGQWSLTTKGKGVVENARPGVVITVYMDGANAVLWAEAEAAVKTLESESIQAIITSPPYPLLRKKEYAGQLETGEHIAWLADFFAAARRTLCPSGSLALNLGPAWNAGVPTQSLWGEKLAIELCEKAGYHLAQKLYWHNPSKMPSPAQWVTIKRVRVTPAIEEVWWFSKTEHPKADNRRVLRPYSQAMLGRLAQGGEKHTRRKPSGHCLKAGAFSKDNGGAIAHNLICAPHCQAGGKYLRSCRERGHKAHPARFPEALATWLIELLSEKGDILWDPFAGSLTVAEAAAKTGRGCISSEINLNYALDGIAGRLAP